MTLVNMLTIVTTVISSHPHYRIRDISWVFQVIVQCMSSQSSYQFCPTLSTRRQRRM